MVTVADIAGWVERRYPPRLAESWDAIGVVCGRPETEVTNILVTVDVTAAVVDEAISAGTQFILAHHPLLLNGVTSVATTSYEGELLHSLIESGCALMSAHTNADAARPGVSDALAEALGLADLRPLDPAGTPPVDKLVVFVPATHAEQLLDALTQAGAGRIGHYDRCGYMLEGTGTFRPLPGATPHTGKIGVVENVSETRLEMVLPRSNRDDVVAALRAVHPYEEPAFDIVKTAPIGSSLGLGRVGSLPSPMSLTDFRDHVETSLPRSGQGVRAGGDPATEIQTVAVCGGSGDSLLDQADNSGADVYVTADLKHHRASEHLSAGGCALINVSHWASEFPWCGQVAAELSAALNSAGDTVSVRVSEIVTDPWLIV